MTVVIVLACIGLVALLVAVITGNTAVAVGVIALALVGMGVLLRDWRREKKQSADPESEASATGTEAQSDEDPDSPMSADMFKPDISTDPNGPSSDARAD